MKKWAIIAVSILLIVAMLLTMLTIGSVFVLVGVQTNLFGLIPYRVEFGFKYEEDDIERFAKRVCKNIEAESVRFEGIDTENGISATISVKLDGMIEEKVDIHFDPEIKWNWDDSVPQVADVRVYFFDSDCTSMFYCKKAVVEGIEKSFFGTIYASEYIDLVGTHEIEVDYRNSLDERMITEYYVRNKANVEIFYDYNMSHWGVFGDDWRAVYEISRK